MDAKPHADAQPLLIDGVAATTVHRDRDEVELALVQLLQQFLEAESVALRKVVRDGDLLRAVNRITVRARADGGFELLRNPGEATVLALRPDWLQCIEAREIRLSREADGSLATLFPVVTDGCEYPGLLEIQGRRGLTPRELHLVRGILRIIRNHLDLLDYGERDTLTGLLNRKTFEAQFDKLCDEVHEQRRGTDPAERSWMGLVDIDRFKSINDRFGHLFGDEVLLLVSQLIQRTFRSSDRVYRFGGEEFVILLHHVPESAVQTALERLRATVEQHRFPQVGNITVSIGWTQILPHDGPTTCMERADAALYFAKGAGRNQVCHYETLVTEGRLKAVAGAPEVELF